MKHKILILFCLIFKISNAQLQNVSGNSNASNLAQILSGNGVTVTNATFSGKCDSLNQAGTFSCIPNTVFGLDSGIVLSSGRIVSGISNGVNITPLGNTPGLCGANFFASTSFNGGGDADLTLAANNAISHDACILEFDFVPTGDTVRFEYVFGSEEYDVYNCSINDVFGFFISGPGITGPYSNNAKNIALIPGTNIPVSISTINNGKNNGPNSPCMVNTNFNGPYTNFYVSNIDSFNNSIITNISYTGFTKKLTAEAVVTPCQIYHLKLGVADASDWIFDSGVFLKAGSLSSNSIAFQTLSTLNVPQPYVVEGCAAGLIKITRGTPTPFPFVVNYGIGGNAVNGVDYNTLSGSVTIPANDTVAYINIVGIADNISEPTETLRIYQYAPCTTNIVDSVDILITDNYIANIVTNDTIICETDFVNAFVAGSDSLTYVWSPSAGVNNVNIKNPTINSAIGVQTYFVKVTYPIAGCPILYDTLVIEKRKKPTVNVGPDRIICKDMVINYNPVVTPTQTQSFTWTGTGSPYLNSTSIINPVGTFNTMGNFDVILTVDPQVGSQCITSDTMNVEVIPNDITIVTPDTIVCQGAVVPIEVNGHPYFSYQWTPPTFLNNAFIEDPISTPDTTITYTVTANYPGCTPMIKSINIEVQPVPVIDAGLNRDVCDWDSIQLQAVVIPSWYGAYIYNWSPGADLNSSTIPNPVFSGHNSTSLQLIVSTPIGCSDTDNVFIDVHPTEFSQTTPATSSVCPWESIQYNSVNGISYLWEPNLYLNNNTIPNPIASPPAQMIYTVYATSIYGCTDTDKVEIHIAPGAVIDAGEDVTIYPGENYQIQAHGNASIFNWFPPYALSSTTISNPVASPSVTTKYIVTGQTEFGCLSSDSITIRVSTESILDLPNAFSPGSGTSINDKLTIKKRGEFTLNSFKIFNRWGNLVWQTTDINDGWNGRMNDIPQPTGVYVYVIEAKSSTGKIFFKQGNVTLIR